MSTNSKTGENPTAPPDNAGPSQEDRDARGRFTRGHSGNPGGRPHGCRRKSTRLLEQILVENGEQLLRRAIEVALGDRGGPTLRAILPHLIAPLQPQGPSVECGLPPVASVADAAKAAEAILSAVAVGELDIGTAERMVGMLTTVAKLHEAAEFEARLIALEQAREQGKEQ